MSLLDGEPRSATIVATTDLRLLIVDRSHFWQLLDDTPDLVRRILTILSRRVRRLGENQPRFRNRGGPTRRWLLSWRPVPEPDGHWRLLVIAGEAS